MLENKFNNNDLEKYFIWHIQGGLGKNIAATSLISSIKKTYKNRKIIIVASHIEAYLNNPDIFRVYALGNTPYFYENYIENKNVIISKQEPYNQTGHITKNKHLIENWCDLMSLEYKEQLPVILPNYAQAMMPNMWKRSKPVMVIQTNGGPLVGQKQSYSWTRDMPIEVANSIVKKFSNDYHIIQITRTDGYHINGVERIDKQISNMELFSLIVASQKRVFIDSSLQHAAAAFNKPSTVFWVGTSPDVFGYNMHNNIKANLPKKANQLINSYMFDFQFSDNLHECPYMEIKDLFDLNLILNKI